MDAIRQALRVAQQSIAPVTGTTAQFTSLGTLDSTIRSYELALDTVTPLTAASTATDLHAQLQSTHSTISDTNKQHYIALNKLSRAIDKRFPVSAHDLIDPSLFSSDTCTRALDNVVLDYLLRAGYADVAHVFAEETGLGMPEQQAHLYAKLGALCHTLAHGTLQPMLEWALAHREALRVRESPLEYLLFRQTFLNIMRGQASGVSLAPAQTKSRTNISAAYHYGRKHFVPYLGTHLNEIQRLFMLLLYVPEFHIDAAGASLQPPPSTEALLSFVPPLYRSAVTSLSTSYEQIAEQLYADYCALAGIPQRGPLQVSVDVGANIALRRIIKARSVMKDSKNGWSQADELPIEIPLPAELQFHSTFLCPVSKEPGTENNPPMMLPCGHVLCRDSLTHVARGVRVKCPYCPVESNAKDALRLYF
ncbi:hypothetical protein MVES1_003106 [Malassezia vespertilionis]|uniref:GID complex catalytic subunit 2 n=1 Tax=Malassezia vespertilionis TaxID=2020962 RepID=A0A2N1J9P7_9BASI|nr:uncharacterized protein MVES1_003106 [Malassezia vespertilionis]PKI83280.1 hypothetical protein MVES_002948 [Malassezia vespertilionis]WFD07736.1 hypothetical protein MVES1_003106 [Malassezia vespertilionis]